LKKLLILFFIFLSFKCFSNSEEEISGLNRSSSIPEESIEGTSDAYFEGYIQALVDMHFYEYRVVVLVHDGTVWLANIPKNELIAKSIKSFVKDVPGVENVKILNGIPPKVIKERKKYVNRPRVKGIWFPQSTQLYQTMIANPRNVTYGIGYRCADQVISKNVIYVSMGDDFPIFRWLEVGPWKGDLQIGIEAGIWSVFDVSVKKPNINRGTALVNTDFYCGIPLSYAVNKWSFRFRVYHMSSHLGDEFLVNHPGYKRVNPSFEAIDFFTSFQASDIFRVYFGPGFVLHSDDSFPLKRWYIEYGGEARFLGRKIYYHKLYGNFIFGVFFRNWQVLHMGFDGTYVFGYELSKLQGIGRKIRFLASYHHGYSLEGQFFKEKTSYGTIGFSYGF
jgi:hypothetical protein